MLRSVVISLFVLLLVLLGYFFLVPSSSMFDEQVVNLQINEKSVVVGYRKNAGGASVPFTYHYFYIGNDSKELSDRAPFLVTKSDDVVLTVSGANRIMVAMEGEILSFRNRAWANVDGNLEPLKIDIKASYQ